MTWWTTLRRWWHDHPLVGDAVLALALLALGLVGQPNPQTGRQVEITPTIAALLVLGCTALVARRRAPEAVWLVTLLAAAVSVARAGGPSPAIITPMVAIYTLATLRRPAVAVLAAALTPVVLLSAYVVGADGSWVVDATYTIATVSALACAIGFAVRSNRTNVASAHERARIAEQTREEEALRRVTQERLRIARELHDVVAHHIAVITVQSGVARHLVRTDPDAAAEALGHVREASAVVLDEMGTILGLLRTGDDAGAGADDTDVERPAPVLGQVDRLVEAVRRNGTAVTLRTSGAARELAPGTELAAYRLIQESLTNAGKHGAGSAEVSVEYGETSVTIDVVNPVPAGSTPGRGGHGLVGMRERVAALGGHLVAADRGDGRFAVHAVLPLRAGPS